MATEEEDNEQELAIARCLREGSVWLNPVFRFHNKAIRIFRRRITVLEILWGFISAIVTAAILSFLKLIFGESGMFFVLFSPIGIVFWSIMAMIFGRRIAFMSPLRRQTGEGTGTWVSIMFRRIITRVSFVFARPVMYNYCTSRAGDPHFNEQRVECIEWLGTAHAPRTPFSPREIKTEHPEVALIPRGVTIRNHRRIV